jgi:hypothetical protein
MFVTCSTTKRSYMRRILLLSLSLLVAVVVFSGCVVTVDVQNRYPGQPLPEQVLPPRNITIPLLQIFGDSSEWVDYRIYRVRDSRVFVRPVDVHVVNMTQREWFDLSTNLRIDGDARATCSLYQGGRVPWYRCEAPPYAQYWRHYDRRF